MAEHDAGGSRSDFGGPPPPPPPPPPAGGSGDGGWDPSPAYPTAPPKAGRSKLALAAILIGVLATLGGAVFAASQIAGDEGSPEKAVEKLLDAASHEDVLGALEAIPPSERDSIKGGLNDIFAQAKRLQLLSDDADLNKLAGIDIEFQDVKLASKSLRDDLASVSFVSGTAKTSADPKKLPLGSFVRDVAGSALAEATPTSDSSPATGDDVMVTVKEDGKWYVSIWYSLAESARKDSGLSLPDKTSALKAKGAASPETAVNDLLRAGATLDLRRMLELMPPDEARALHDYAPLFLPQAESGVADIKKFFTIDIGTLDLAAATSGDHSLVTVKKLAFTGTAGPPDEKVQFSYADGCVSFGAVGGAPQRFCANELRDNPEQFLSQFGIPPIQLPKIDIKNPAVGFVTVQRDGDWYVSPTRTVLEDIAGVMRVLDRSHLDQFKKFAEQMTAGYGSQVPN